MPVRTLYTTLDDLPGIFDSRDQVTRKFPEDKKKRKRKIRKVQIFEANLVKVNYRFRMDADKLQAGPIALEELCKQPKKDGSDFLVL